MRVALAQVNPIVGDIPGNTALAAAAIAEAADLRVDVVILPELAIVGYPPEDLLLRPEFARRSRAALDELATGVDAGIALVGFVDWGDDCRNAAAVIAAGRVQAVYHKRFLPNYGVFDEARYFAAGTRPMVVEALGLRLGIVICEDIWYPSPISGELAAARLDLICCLSASPFHRGKGDDREAMLVTRARDAGTPLAFCNQVGGQDELVFDGRSVVIDAAGEVIARAPSFASALTVADLDLDHTARVRLREPRSRQLAEPIAQERVPVVAREPAGPGGAGPLGTIAAAPGDAEELWLALTCGIRDYVEKNRFPGVVIGLSGGIDSALTAALACDAVGAARVLGVAMPSEFTSDVSTDDAAALAACLGMRLVAVPIDGVVAAFETALGPVMEGRPRDITEENLQARARGTLLMAVSNKLGPLVLATGNKSEMSVGYSTLYGDMVGGFAPLRDVTKTWVYRLASWRNARDGRGPIPQRTIERAPSAELRPDQRDTDSLPPYDVLDPIIEGYVERDLTRAELVGRGADPAVVTRVITMIDRAEYKRRQGPVGIKITPRAFGRDRRMPITYRNGEA